MNARRIVKALIEDEHHQLWDQLVAAAEAGDSQLDQYVDLIADIYNGGIQQCIEHGRGFDQFLNAAQTLRSRGGQASQNLAGVLRGLQSSYVQAAAEYEEAIQNARHGRGYDPDFDPFAEYAEQWDAAEDFIYNHANMDAVHRELLQASVARERSKATSLISQQTA
jgi:hypothetical protein